MNRERAYECVCVCVDIVHECAWRIVHESRRVEKQEKETCKGNILPNKVKQLIRHHMIEHCQHYCKAI